MVLSPARPPQEATAGDSVDAVITVSGLVKRYGTVEAVRGIDLSVARGEIFGFLGPNGAGKSTTISVLCTLLKPTAGTASVAGLDVNRDPDGIRARIGLVFQDPSLDVQLSARENLLFHAMAYGVPRSQRKQRIAQALTTVDLTDRADALVSTFSGGMKRRLEIARGILHHPEVLFLDEPTQGLDPQTRAKVWEHLREIRASTGLTVFMTTHYMEEAEWCDRIAIIDHGTIVALGTPDELKAQVGGDIVVLSTADNASAVEEIAGRLGVQALVDGESLRIEVADGSAFVPQLIMALSMPVRNVTVRRPSLDDVFLKLTGRAIREEEGEGRTAMMRAFAMRRGGR
ncbi:MAG: ATP-binding cassette domain-containing protein [Candidatus Dormibacteraeota bacterium]|uniref:ATP-binding cassette domain-containing protein n=1 Tax=Candidatus Amunia macphersoniae TaxID=3127014 RepID=A0A934KNU8_9BACT|nr:ATP-binding cassette domain-containing protein [Candidatus Dormibacteraeota bacterium]